MTSSAMLRSLRERNRGEQAKSGVFALLGGVLGLALCAGLLLLAMAADEYSVRHYVTAAFFRADLADYGRAAAPLFLAGSVLERVEKVGFSMSSEVLLEQWSLTFEKTYPIFQRAKSSPA